MTTTGWVKIYRSLLVSEIYNAEPFDKCHAWIDLILRCDLEGQMMLNATELAEAWKWNRMKVYRFIEWLEKNGMIKAEKIADVTESDTRSVTRSVTRLTLVNFGFYQSQQTRGDTRSVTNPLHDNGGKGDIDTVVYEEEERINTPLESIINNTFSSPTEGRSNTAEAGLTESVSQTEKRPTLAAIEREMTKEFDEVWKLYPRKSGKPNALRDYIKARNSGIEKQTILDGLNAYLEYIRANGTEERYIKMGSTWFHQHSWEDDYSGRPSANTRNGRPLSRREREELELEEWFKNHE